MEPNDNKEIILAYEKQFAAILANKILVKPKLNAWMIFIPFIFIFYFQDFSQYKKQRKEFIENYFLSRKKALNEAEDAIYENRKPDTMTLAEQAGLKTKAAEKYGKLLAVLADHYTELLKSSGTTYTELISDAYGSRGNYLLFINQLNTVEKELNRALKISMKKTQDGIVETIRRIEKNSDQIRRDELKEIYV